MATVDEILAAAERAEKAGDAPAAKVLRDRAAQMQAADAQKIRDAAERAKAAGDMPAFEVLTKRLAQMEASGMRATGTGGAVAGGGAAGKRSIMRGDRPEEDFPGQVPPRPVDPAVAAAEELAAFEAANPVLKGRYTAGNLPKAGEGVSLGKFGKGGYLVKPWRRQDMPEDTFGETAAAMIKGPMAAMRSFGGGLVGGPSPSRAALAADPLTQNLPPFALTGLGAIGDVGGAALSALGAGIGGLTGLASELVPGQGSQGERKFAEDLTAMSMFAVPELAGVSSMAGRAATAAPARAPEVRMPPVAEAPMPVAPVADAARVAPPNVAMEKVADLTRKAASGGMGSVKAQRQLAKLAKVNPEAKAAAERLGFDLPPDVFADDDMVLSFIGATRGELASEAEAAWTATIRRARDRADEIISELDGSPDIASVSETVKASLQTARDELKRSAQKMYDLVDARVPKRSPATVDNTTRALAKMIEDMGGEKGLSPSAKKLYAMITDPDQPVTYGRLIAEKNIIGQNIGRLDGPYGDMDTATLKKLYAAMSEDQLATVTAIGDPELRAVLRTANQTTAKQKGLEDRIVGAFGSDLDGSIGAKLRSAVKSAAAGDIAGLNRIIKIIPEDLRRNAVMSAIAAATRSARATEPGFGMTEFSKLFSGIMTNKPVYNLIGSTIGPEAIGMLKELQGVAQRLSIVDGKVQRTGKANQIKDLLNADGIIAGALNSTGGQRVTQAAAIGAGTAVGGPVGGMLAGPIATALMRGKPEMMKKAGAMFASDEFQKLVMEAATQGAPKKATVEAFTRTPAFRRWADGLAPAARKEFLQSIGVPAGGQAAVAASPDYETLWQRYGR